MVVLSNACCARGARGLVPVGPPRRRPAGRGGGDALIATFPGAVFLCAAYTEGPFLLLAAATLLAMADDRPWVAAAACTVAGAMRPTAAGLVVTLVLWTWYRGDGATAAAADDDNRARSPKTTWRASADLPASARPPRPPCRLPALPLRPLPRPQRLPSRAGPVGPLRGHGAGLRDPRGPHESRLPPRTRVNPPGVEPPVRVGLVLLAVVGLAQRRVPRVTFVLPIVTFLITYLPQHGAANCLARFELIALPCFLLLGWWAVSRRSRLVLAALLFVGLAFQLWYACLFSRGIWVG